jgi:hypothetical protein
MRKLCNRVCHIVVIGVPLSVSGILSSLGAEAARNFTPLQDSHTVAALESPPTDTTATPAVPAVSSDHPDSRPTDLSDPESSRIYLLKTAHPGGAMSRQGPELAVSRLHPDFVIRLANSIFQARRQGMKSAGIFSAYRPPGLGVGGFADKYMSLHSYGLAVDMHGIGGPGSAEAALWHKIAAAHQIPCPYGSSHRAEWNHCQATPLKAIRADSPLRTTVTASGPTDLDAMFHKGDLVIAQQEILPSEGSKLALQNAVFSVSLATPLRHRTIRVSKRLLEKVAIGELSGKKGRSHMAESLRIYAEESTRRKRYASHHSHQRSSRHS